MVHVHVQINVSANGKLRWISVSIWGEGPERVKKKGGWKPELCQASWKNAVMQPWKVLAQSSHPRKTKTFSSVHSTMMTKYLWFLDCGQLPMQTSCVSAQPQTIWTGGDGNLMEKSVVSESRWKFLENRLIWNRIYGWYLEIPGPKQFRHVGWEVAGLPIALVFSNFEHDMSPSPNCLSGRQQDTDFQELMTAQLSNRLG